MISFRPLQGFREGRKYHFNFLTGTGSRFGSFMEIFWERFWEWGSTEGSVTVMVADLNSILGCSGIALRFERGLGSAD